MTQEEVYQHYLRWATELFPGKGKDVRLSRLMAAYDKACADLAVLLAERNQPGTLLPEKGGRA